MHILFYCEDDNGTMLKAFRDALLEHTVHAWSPAETEKQDGVVTDFANAADTLKAQISIAIVWMPPDNFFDGLTGLTHVFSISAGVDNLLQHRGLPLHIPVYRLHDAGMAEQMAEYALYGVLHAQRNMHEFMIAGRNRQWAHELDAASAVDTRVGILGAGALGAKVARKLALNHYSVTCWSRSAKEIGGNVKNVHGAKALSEFLTHTDVLICLLPLTPETQGILNWKLFRQLPKGCYLINPGRGDHLVEQDLLEALDEGQLSGALLDVFSTEPLPKEHRFWSHPRILITPHVAAKSLIGESVAQIVANINKLQTGQLPSGGVNRQSGY